MIMDYYLDKWNQPPYKSTPEPITWPIPQPVVSPLTEQEITELRKLLQRAKEYDEKTNQKDCELEEKKEKLRKLAKELGIEINFP